MTPRGSRRSAALRPRVPPTPPPPSPDANALKIAFGTDGWRGVIADTCTFAEIRRIAAATARWYASADGPGDPRRIVVGHDPRFLSPELARAAAEVFAAAGIDVLL